MGTSREPASSKSMKYVLVSGGVISGIGKGIIASSTGLLLKTKGLKVTSVKIDPYMNVDAGTMAPTEHGEVFVLDDGGEVDLDLGNYERYLNVVLKRDNNITTGKIYQEVIQRERRGDYLGKTVQVVPHVTNCISEWIQKVSRIPVDDSNETPDACIIELGGTVGDIESMPFIEGMRSLRLKAGKNNFLHIHVSLVPVINSEQKSKPTQQAIRDVRSAGLFPDLIACRCDRPLEQSTVEKIAHFCQVDLHQVLAVQNVPTTYHVPMLLEQQGLLDSLRDILRLDEIVIPDSLARKGTAIWTEWMNLTTSQDRSFGEVAIALVGKYTNLHDSYLSVIKALEHSAMRCRRQLKLVWVDASQLEKELDGTKEYFKAWHDVSQADGILVPGGFGQRGTEGMISAIKWARENKKPFLGICLGMQLAVIEHARNIMGMQNAHSEEIHPDAEHKAIIFMPEGDKTIKGGTMRLGSRVTYFQPGSEWSRMRALYEHSERVTERHRHRYEVNPDLVDEFQKSGLHFVGKDESGKRMEIVELKEDHPFFVGVQFHPEYLSRVLEPSRPYLGLVAASAGLLDEITHNLVERSRRKSSAQLNGLPNGIHETSV